MAQNSFQVLPLELLRLIKDSISYGDLRTHVCFYLVCETLGVSVGSLYGRQREQERFWETCCIMSGLGFLPDDKLGEDRWKKVAFQIIQKGGFCDHPGCGGNQLDQNRKFSASCKPNTVNLFSAAPQGERWKK